MSETRTTACYAGAALLLGLIAWSTAPRIATPSVFGDRGALFFPDFIDPNVASSLEVTEFDEQNGTVRPLKVLNRNGRWTIPSHHDYPADAKDRLAQTAAAIVALRKDDLSSDAAADYERCGVLDPLDTARPGVKGRGTRITIRGENERLLADIIVGSPVEGHPGFRYVRLPDQRRIYVSRVGDLKISTDFGDWIERDVLQVSRNDIDAIHIRNYSLDESSGKVTPRELLVLRKKGPDEWAIDGMNPDEEVDATQINSMITNLVELKIVGVLPKPPGISASLSNAGGGRITTADRNDLARKGFYLTPDGQLLSNEGEVLVHTASGIVYTLRFGQVAPGTADVLPASGGAEAGSTERSKPGENRYLFIMTAVDPAAAKSAGGPNDVGEERASVLRARFAPWYYIISSGSFGRIRAQRADLVKTKGHRRPA